jgi:tryptophan synthase beta subunit
MTPETTTKTKFGIYGGQFIPETLMPDMAHLKSVNNKSGD